MANQSILTTQTPNLPDASDGTSYELGVKFVSNQAGQVVAIRYYKSPSETGTHTGTIWNMTAGNAIASVTFVGESGSGWQEQALNTPLNLQAGETYIVSVNCNSHFSLTYNELATSITNGNLSTVVGNNGVFAAMGVMPLSSYSNTNYYRDIVFSPTPTPTIIKVSGDDQTDTEGNVLPNPLVVQVNDSNSNPQAGVTVEFAVTAGGGTVGSTSVVTNAGGQAETTLTLGSTNGGTLPVTNTVTATATGIGSVTFNATANSANAANNQTIFGNQSPGLNNANDGSSYELGTKFRSAKSGQINTIRFYKASSETGTHVGKIWSEAGIQLGNVTFTDETSSGWQEQSLSSPISIQANTTYIVSVNVNSHFALTYDALASTVTSGDLSTVAGNNGVYGNINTFPTNSYRNSNYFTDIVFLAGSTITKIDGDNQQGTVNTALPTALKVKVIDGSDNPQSGVTVDFAVTAGGGTVDPVSAVTNGNGETSTTLTLGSIPSGPNDAVTVTATALGIGSVTFSAKAIPENANDIYLENQKPGTTAWKVNNRGTNGEIVGFATQTSVNKGGSLDIKVSLAVPGNFSIDTYRLGYYQGLGGRLVNSSGSLSGITQPAYEQTPVAINSAPLAECNWSTSYTLQVGNDWTTGLYIAKLTEQASGEQSEVWFVVRDDNGDSDVLFQSSFTTFLAYNSFGDGSLYGYNSLNGIRAFKVSYDTPFAQSSKDFLEWNSLLRWEYNMVRWLESQSYDVSYVTNMDVHANSSLLQQHKVFLSVGHDEYWSEGERNHVEQARDGNQPVNLAFFSANSAYWRVRFENSTITGQSNRVMVCYKQDATAGEPTDKWRSTLNNRPENALLGVMYTGDYDQLYGGFDFVVTNSSDPYYANTGLNNGDYLTQLVGFEWDAKINNGDAPGGLVTLSESPVIPKNTDKDVPAGTNTQISHAVRYSAPSGGKVFATGSIQWMWGLDSFDVPTPREDIRVQQIAVNILADMGAKPVTPDPGIVVPS
ncbi:MAG: N,N-dimethylformamidase beta subunit family domain-containing protein [Cyanobacteria bacterium P01_A01_bin.84]